MSDVKWIKITTDMFDNRKIRHLRKLPEGNSIVLIWVMLLAMAGKCNDHGKIYLTENIPYTPKMLADELDFEENTVQLALQALEQLDMIVMEDEYFSITGWEEHQNIEGMDRIREQNRIRKQRQREKERLIAESRVMSRDSHAIEEDKERDIDKEEDKNKESKEKVTCEQVVALYHSICVSYPKVISLSEARKRAIRERLKMYSMDDFRMLFEKAEASSFLKGANNRNWSAKFDWMIKDANMAKVIDGNYDDGPWSKQAAKQPSGNNTAKQLDDFYNMATEWAAQEDGDKDE
ncbi:phage replisome organizer N-terminal domain-containing protein [Mediterraneibacter faecis]